MRFFCYFLYHNNFLNFTTISSISTGGPSRRHHNQQDQNNDSYSFSMDFMSTDMPSSSTISSSSQFDQQQQRSTTATHESVSNSQNFTQQKQQPTSSNFLSSPIDHSFGGFANVPTTSVSHSFNQQHQFNNNPYGGGGFSVGGPTTTGITNPFGGTNQQFLMAAGEQLLTNPMTKAAIDAYSQSLVDKSKTWIDGVRSY